MAIKLYAGTDSQGDQREVAVRDDGTAFGRAYVSRGRFGYGWTKWQPTQVEYATHYECKYTGQKLAYPVPPVQCGFANLRLVDADCKRVRLPAGGAA